MKILDSRPKVRRNYSIASVYKRSFLRGDFLDAVNGASSLAYSEFQRDIINNRLPDFQADRILLLGEEFGDNGAFVDLFFHIEDELTEFHSSQYRVLSEFDQYRRVKLKNRGRFLSFADFGSHPDFNPDQKMSEVFANMGVSDGVSACFGVPFNKAKAIYMSYVLLEGRTLAEGVNRWELEYMSLPFLIGWLYRMKLVDADTFDSWLSALEELTPMQVFLIRDIVNVASFKPEETAEKFQISRRTVEAHIQSIVEAKLQRSNGAFRTARDRHSSRLLDIANHFNFMVFAHQTRTGQMTV